jgi:2,3-bisphosphoglycerate-independent phosphoglycerate mutase
MNETPSDFICLNFANPDMVGHTGVFEAIVKAVTTVDKCLGEIVEQGKKIGFEFIIIADHGNADLAINEDGTVHTAHTLNPVPVIYISDKTSRQIEEGILADIAPTILHLFGIEQPSEMTGNSLLT